MMKKWGLLLLFLSSLTVATDVFSQYGSATLPCCWKSQVHFSKACCEDGAWGNEAAFEWRELGTDGACCSKSNVVEAFAEHSSGEYFRDAVLTQTCCESQNKKGKDPGNYAFWPTPGSASVADGPGKAGVCCIKDSWKWWSTGSNNGRCCRAQGGKEQNNHCCFDAYDLDSKGHSKECCKAAEGKWENGECCGSEKDGMAMANKMQNKLESDGTVTITMSGAKVTSNCCTGDGGKAYNSAFNGGDAELGCCFNGDPYGVSYTSDNNLVEGCCEKPKKVTDLGDLDACCEEGEEGYIATTTGKGGEEEKAGACCKGEVFIKKFVEPRDGNYGNMDCCPIGEYVIDGACCKNKDDKAYPNSDFYDCCPSSNYADGSNGGEGECCEDPTSPRNMKGKPTKACCEHAYGEWVVSSGSSGDPDKKESSASCCRGSMDIMTGSRTEACCQNASGIWMGTFCCGSWGKKVDGACKADSLPDSVSGDKG